MSAPSEGTRRPRLELGTQIGAGGMGVVYEAYDRISGRRLAVKTLREPDAQLLLRLKQEFRSLADLHHPNLVALYELVEQDGQWLLLMERVDGVDFVTHVRGVPVLLPSPDSVTRPQDAASSQNEPVAVQGQLDVARLRSGLSQLCQGLLALHSSGQIHRDLKPSNVRVDGNGRVVILDFGLVQNLSAPPDPRIIGTARYMSPEQARGEPLSFASDWYSVGCILYESLAGAPPHGSGEQALRDKNRFAPLPPDRLATNVPADLSELCVRLLQHDAQERPRGLEILQVVSEGELDDSLVWEPQSFVGRDVELASLQKAFEESQRGCAAAVFVRGASGMGKTSLVHHFLERLARQVPVLTFAGRCYESESLPFKGVDALMDALAQHLRRFPDALPSPSSPLLRLFPALRPDSPAIAKEPDTTVPPEELRRLAFVDLAALLRRLRTEGPVVLFVDDLQWADEDSLLVISEVLSAPGTPPILWVFAHRTEDWELANRLWHLLHSSTRSGPVCHEVQLEPLPEASARALAGQLLVDPGTAMTEQIVRESGGHPFFLQQLVRLSRTFTGPMARTRAPATLENLLAWQLEHLDPLSAHLLRAVALAAQPTSTEVLRQLVGYGQDLPHALRALRAKRLLRLTRTSGEETFETYHDRIRAAVDAGLLGEERRLLHRQLASALEQSRTRDLETIVSHFLLGGDEAGAAHHLLPAAKAAFTALAFERAVALCRLGLGLSARPELSQFELRQLLAESLVNAGRGREASEVYQLLAQGEGVPVRDARVFQRMAADQMIRAGHFEEGVQLFRELARRAGVRAPHSLLGRIADLLWARLRLALRGLEFSRVAEEDVPLEERELIDLHWSVGAGLSLLDYVAAAAFNARYLRLALRAGETNRIATGLAFDSGFLAARGVAHRSVVRRLLDRAAALAQDNRAHAVVALIENTNALVFGDWAQSLQWGEKAEQTLSRDCVGLWWELATTRQFQLQALFFLGRMRELTRRVFVLLPEAERRGDLYAASNLRMGVSVTAWLAAGDLRAARTQTLPLPSRIVSPLYSQTLLTALAQASIALYAGDGGGAVASIATVWPAFRRSAMFHVEYLRILTCHIRSQAHLLATRQGVREMRRGAEWAARQLAQEKAAWARPFALQARAGIDLLGGPSRGAGKRLREAQALFERLDMPLFAQAAAWRAAQVMGDGAGAEGAQRELAREVLEPARFAAILTPTVG